MMTPITESQANILLLDKANKAKPLKLKVLKILCVQKGFMMNDGRVLVFKDECYSLMDLSTFTDILYKHESAMLKNYSAEDIVSNLHSSLEIFNSLFNRHEYDFSINSLDYIDEDLNRLQKKGTSEAELFVPLVTYIGEVLIRVTQGKWGNKNGLYGPIVTITGENNKEYDPYICIRKILVDKKRPFAIYAAITNQLKY